MEEEVVSAENKEPDRSKVGLSIALFFASLFLAGSIVLSYLYASQLRINKALVAERNTLAFDLSQLEAATEVGTANWGAKIAKALAYTDFFEYLNSITTAHNGYSGWTSAEFANGRALAQATGDASFVTVVEESWEHDTAPQLPRLLSVWEAIRQGIESALK